MKSLLTALLLAFSLTFVACGNEEPATTDDATNAVQDAADATRDAAEDAANQAQDAANSLLGDE